MLVVKKVEKSNPPRMSLSGVIDETTEFGKLLGAAGKSLHIECRDVGRINSVGIKLWRDFFQHFRNEGGTVTFYELSPALVSTINYVSDFVEKHEVASICAPFHCGKCNATTLKIYSQEEAKRLLNSVEKVACTKCQAQAELDEIPDEYLSFLF